MKKIVIVILLSLCIVNSLHAYTEKVKEVYSEYFYGEVIGEIEHPFYVKLITTHNFTNETQFVLLPWISKPLNIARILSLELGPQLRSIKVKDSPRINLFEVYITPGIYFNNNWCNIKLVDEFRINLDPKSFHANENIFSSQIRVSPNRFFQTEFSYSTWDDFGHIKGRQMGVSSEFRTRIGFNIAKCLEVGAQATTNYYESKIWQSQYRPKGGGYIRITALPFWLELSYERLSVKEKDLRNGKVQPALKQNRIFIAAGFNTDTKSVKKP